MTTTRDEIAGSETGSAAASGTEPDEGQDLREGFRNLLPLIVKRLGAIPTLPGVLARGLPLLAREDLPVHEAARLVSCDPALTAKVLKVINSPLYGLRYKVSTLSHALAMLGPRVLPRVASSVRSVEPDLETASAWSKLWRHGLATALAARRIAQKVGYDLPDEAFTAGILHDLGASVLLLYGPRAVERARHRATAAGMDATAAERDVLGADHAQVGAMIAERWNLPRLLRDVIRHHHDGPANVPRSLDPKNRELVGIVAAADLLAEAAGYGRDTASIRSLDTLPVGDAVELPPDEVEAIGGEVTHDLSNLVGLLGLESPVTRELAPLTSRPGTSVPSTRPLAPRMAALADLLADLRAVDDPDEILPRAIEGLHASLGFDRILYLESGAGGRRLAGRHFHDGTPVRIEMRDLDLELGSHPGLGRALAPGAALRLRSDEDSDPVLVLFGVQELVAASLTLHGNVDGLLVVDTFFTDEELSEEDVSLLRTFALSVGALVENRGLSRQTRHLRQLAEKDELMGINNRRSLMQALEKEVDRSHVEGVALSVVMIDVDHFKSWNDVYGHQVGDRILRELAKVVQEASRDADVVGRYGGEEFLVVLKDTRQDAGIIYAERLRRAVEQLHRKTRTQYPEVPLTLSMGVAELQPQEAVHSLIQRVDRALYAAKRRGRDRVCASS